MNYEILDHIRYYKTKQEEREGQTIITVNAYNTLDGIMVPPNQSTKKGNGQAAKNITIRLNESLSPFPSIPYSKELQQHFINEILMLENIHVQIGFNQTEFLKDSLLQAYFLKLKMYYETSVRFFNQGKNGIELMNDFAYQILKPLFPSFFEEKSIRVYPVIVPARLQQKDETKKEDKYFFYQRYIKRLQRYYNTDKVIYMECSNFGFGVLLFPLQIEKEEVLPYHTARFKERNPFFHANTSLVDMSAYYKHFGFLPIKTEILLKGGE